MVFTRGGFIPAAGRGAAALSTFHAKRRLPVDNGEDARDSAGFGHPLRVKLLATRGRLDYPRFAVPY